MIQTKNKASLALATTAALLLTGCATNSDNTAPKSMQKGQDMGQCHGTNACKGKSACATAESSCVGHNACKGKGWIPSSQQACEATGGTFKKK